MGSRFDNILRKSLLRLPKHGFYKNINLKTQLIASYIIISLLVLSISAFFSYQSIQSILQKQSEKSTIRSFQQAEYNIDSILEEIDRISRTILVDPKVQKFLEDDEIFNIDYIYAFNDFVQSVNNITNSYQYIESVFFFKENCKFAGIGKGRTWRTGQGVKGMKFYSSKGYASSKRAFPSEVFMGGFTTMDFEIDPPSDLRKNNKGLITAARGVRSYYQNYQTATLVINVDERKLNSIYGRLADDSESLVYVIDKDGKFISGRDINFIGKQSPLFQRMDTHSVYGSFIEKSENMAMQVIYYRLSHTGWILVKEVPLHEFAYNTSILRKIMILTFIISLFLIVVTYTYWLGRLTAPLKQLMNAMNNLGRGQVGLNISESYGNELGILMRQFNRMSSDIRVLMEQNLKMEQEKRKLEMEALQAQINPHFIYNTLNMIRWMAAMINAKNIADTIIAFNNILRPVFSNRSILWTVGEEMDYVKNYTTIMNYRFGNGVVFVFHIPEAILECKIPRFVLQPLIENSLKHGISGKNNIGNIRISAVDNEDKILFIVEDDGVGIEGEKLKELVNRLADDDNNESTDDSSVGLTNVNHRLKLYFGKQYGIQIYSIDSIGTRISLNIPKSVDSTAIE